MLVAYVFVVGDYRIVLEEMLENHHQFIALLPADADAHVLVTAAERILDQRVCILVICQLQLDSLALIRPDHVSQELRFAVLGFHSD